jgi:L-threonylcarbamoyladenylate synthase
MPLRQDLHLRLAARALRAGGIVACPTEAVWGLSCDPFDAEAVHALLALKQRPVHKGLILVADRAERFDALLAGIEPRRRALLAESWPGPATWLLPHHGLFPAWVTGDSDRIALRVTAHPLLAALCAAFDGPLVSTSANLAGHPPARTALRVRAQLREGIAALVPGELGGQAKPTVIRDLLTGAVVRPA